MAKKDFRKELAKLLKQAASKLKDIAEDDAEKISARRTKVADLIGQALMAQQEEENNSVAGKLTNFAKKPLSDKSSSWSKVADSANKKRNESKGTASDDQQRYKSLYGKDEESSLKKEQDKEKVRFSESSEISKSNRHSLLDYLPGAQSRKEMEAYIEAERNRPIVNPLLKDGGSKTVTVGEDDYVPFADRYKITNTGALLNEKNSVIGWYDAENGLIRDNHGDDLFTVNEDGTVKATKAGRRLLYVDDQRKVDLGNGVTLDQVNGHVVKDGQWIGTFDFDTGIAESKEGGDRLFRVKDDGSIKVADAGEKYFGGGTWFQAGAFEDGYQFGEIGRAHV